MSVSDNCAVRYQLAGTADQVATCTISSKGGQETSTSAPLPRHALIGLALPIVVLGGIATATRAAAQEMHYYSVGPHSIGQPNNFDNDGATGAASIAAGVGTTAAGDASVAMGFSADANGGASVAVGNNAQSNGGASTAVGALSKALGLRSTSFGAQSEASGTDSTAIGAGANASVDNSAALGAESTTTAAATTTTAGTTSYSSADIGGQTYSYAAGTAVGVVSVGSAGAERRIQNVAAGLVTATSTDAVNGSQLYAGINNLQVQINNLTGGGGNGGIDPGLKQQVNQNTAEIAGLQNRIDRLNSDMNWGLATLRSQMTRNEKLANAGIASAAAIGMIRYDDRPGKFSTGTAITTHRRQAAISIGAGYTSKNGNWRFSAAGAFSPTNWKAEATVGASATYTWN
ncbi:MULTISPECIES: YadA-like family protein [unclassified Chelatococcus]|uniref:YadA-like family protein n=1 Tax=unclassified Chelatococcus TaxID=2638111 RepID=UPI001BD1B50C|nr:MULTISPECIES: YadA-like family protein [unclassified Chelatococcus]MBS7698043.1 YadA-like family protein [Chelatococcus sp. YT9]MBX3556639.1 YadA-like family protein [Chelatococcus sp.]